LGLLVLYLLWVNYPPDCRWNIVVLLGELACQNRTAGIIESDWQALTSLSSNGGDMMLSSFTATGKHFQAGAFQKNEKYTAGKINRCCVRAIKISLH